MCCTTGRAAVNQTSNRWFNKQQQNVREHPEHRADPEHSWLIEWCGPNDGWDGMQWTRFSLRPWLFYVSCTIYLLFGCGGGRLHHEQWATERYVTAWPWLLTFSPGSSVIAKNFCQLWTFNGISLFVLTPPPPQKRGLYAMAMFICSSVCSSVRMSPETYPRRGGHHRTLGLYLLSREKVLPWNLHVCLRRGLTRRAHIHKRAAIVK